MMLIVSSKCMVIGIQSYSAIFVFIPNWLLCTLSTAPIITFFNCPQTLHLLSATLQAAYTLSSQVTEKIKTSNSLSVFNLSWSI
jgi:hypothetical protein